MGKLFLLTGDYILNSDGKDAIVNAANKYMANGSGICGAIYRNAGYQLEEYCHNTFKTDMMNGEVRITPGFNLNMDIIHVLAPKYFEEDKPIDELIKAYKNMLDEIVKHNYKNVLLCSLGTGIHGYKHEEVAKQLIFLLNNFCKLNEINLYLNNIYPIYKDIYLKEFLIANALSLKNDLSKLSVSEMKQYLVDNNLIENNIKIKYDDFVKGKELNDMCLTEKLICLQYTLEHFEVTKEQIMVLIERMGE